jgi:hypothetical protein
MGPYLISFLTDGPAPTPSRRAKCRAFGDYVSFGVRKPMGRFLGPGAAATSAARTIVVNSQEIDKGRFKLVCTIVTTPPIAVCNFLLAGGIPGMIAGTVTKASLCSLVCT